MSKPDDPVAALDLEDKARFVVLNQVLGRLGGDDKEAEHFVSVSDGDPSPALLSALNKRWIRLRPASESFIDAKDRSFVKDRKTNKTGVIWKVSEVKIGNDGRIELKGGNHRSNLDSYECVFVLAEKGGALEVLEKKNCLVS